MAGSNDLILRSLEQDLKIRDTLAQVGRTLPAPKDPDPHPVNTDKYSTFGTSQLAANATNPQLFGRWLINIGNALGKSGLAFFVAEQQLLHSLSQHHDGKIDIFNPLYLFNRGPIISDFIPVAIQNTLNRHEDAVKKYDQHAAWVEGSAHGSFLSVGVPVVKTEVNVGSAGPLSDLSERDPQYLGAKSQRQSLATDEDRKNARPGEPLLDLAMRTRNLYGPEQGTYSEDGLSVATLASMVDSAMKDEGRPTGATAAARVTPLLEKTTIGGVQRSVVSRASLSKLFREDRISLEQRPTPMALDRVTGGAAVAGNVEVSAYPHGIIPAEFRGESGGNTYRTRIGDDQPPISDDEAYVPLSFTDLRPIGNELRSVYFRPFIKSLSEDFAPDWNTAQAFGRTDPVVGYRGTTRTISLSFDLHAFSPEDLPVMYRKLNWLSSMVYPEYDSDLLMSSGPVVRMRVGDVIRSSHSRGLSGVITSMGFDYSDSLWELKRDYKAPKAISVSISFLVLHDKIIGRGRDGKFGGISPGFDDNTVDSPFAFRRIGNRTKKAGE